MALGLVYVASTASGGSGRDRAISHIYVKKLITNIAILSFFLF